MITHTEGYCYLTTRFPKAIYIMYTQNIGCMIGKTKEHPKVIGKKHIIQFVVNY